MSQLSRNIYIVHIHVIFSDVFSNLKVENFFGTPGIEWGGGGGGGRA